MTVYAITDTEKGRTGIAPTYLQTTPCGLCRHAVSVCLSVCLSVCHVRVLQLGILT